MKIELKLLVTSLFTAGMLAAPNFDTGSNGSLGDVVISSTNIIDLPPDGVLHYKSLHLQPEGRLEFRRNALNTPVYLLSQGDVTIEGTIVLDGKGGTSSAPGAGGPGGFDGGRPGTPGQNAGAGYGPGGGGPGARVNDAGNVGAGGYLNDAAGTSAVKGRAYGNALLLPIIGGSGGGGLQYTEAFGRGQGGGGGGGALLIASGTRVHFNQASGKVISATGGEGIEGRNGGSGGAVRVVAPTLSGGPRINVDGRDQGSPGRIRFDSLDATQLTPFTAPFSTTSGGVMIVRLNPEPRLDIVEAAGTTIAVGHGELVQIILPTGSNPSRTVTLQARDFAAKVPVEIVLIPDSGNPVVVPAEIDNSTANPAVLPVPVTFPVNVGVTVQAWVRGR